MSSSEHDEDDEDEYTFVHEEHKEDDGKGKEVTEDKDSASEEKEMPKLETIDSEAFELVSSGLRSRHPSGCQGPCSAGPRFDPLESDHTFEEEYAKINRDLDEEPANLHRWRAWLSMFFLVVMTGPPIAAFFLTAKEWVDPLVRVVPADDSQQVKDIFFGGTAWLISCITDKSAAKAPRVLEEAAQLLRPRGVRVARVHCWHPLDTKKGKRTLAQRFGFRAKPPVVMATTGKGSPTFLAATGLPAEALAAKVLAAVIPDAEAPKASIRDAKPRGHSRRVDPVGKRPEEADGFQETEEEATEVEEEEDVNLDEA